MKAAGDLTPDADPQALAFALLASMLLTQTLRNTAPLEAAFDSALERMASFATDPVRARRA